MKRAALILCVAVAALAQTPIPHGEIRIEALKQEMTGSVAHLSGNVTIETDYPHLDSTWPNSQEILWRQVGGLDPDDANKIAWRNAAELFRHEVPASVIADPESW